MEENNEAERDRGTPEIIVKEEDTTVDIHNQEHHSVSEDKGIGAVGTGAVGAAVGGAIGTKLAGRAGALIGAVAGAVAGAMAGKKEVGKAKAKETVDKLKATTEKMKPFVDQLSEQKKSIEDTVEESTQRAAAKVQEKAEQARMKLQQARNHSAVQEHKTKHEEESQVSGLEFEPAKMNFPEEERSKLKKPHITPMEIDEETFLRDSQNSANKG